MFSKSSKREFFFLCNVQVFAAVSCIKKDMGHALAKMALRNLGLLLMHGAKQDIT